MDESHIHKHFFFTFENNSKIPKNIFQDYNCTFNKIIYLWLEPFSACLIARCTRCKKFLKPFMADETIILQRPWLGNFENILNKTFWQLTDVRLFEAPALRKSAQHEFQKLHKIPTKTNSKNLPCIILGKSSFLAKTTRELWNNKIRGIILLDKHVMVVFLWCSGIHCLNGFYVNLTRKCQVVKL